MVKTGWLSDEEPGEVPAMPLTALALGRQQRQAGVLETALARSAAADARAAREAEASRPDPDERAAGLLMRGYRPGLIQELAQRLGDVQAEIETEKEKIQKTALRAQFAAREQAAGRADVPRMLSMMDGDDGDEGRVAALERRAQSLGRQLAEAQEMITPPEARAANAVEEAATQARRILARVDEEMRREDERERAARAQLGRDRARFYGARRGVSSRSQPASVLSAHSAAAGGPEPRVGPGAVPWSRVSGWLARGWRP